MDNDRQFGFFRLDPRLITMLRPQTANSGCSWQRNGFPDLLVDTLLATEDRHFCRARRYQPLLHWSCGTGEPDRRRMYGGASTLTQQLVKTCSFQRALFTGVKPTAYIIVLMDARYSKDRIL